MEQLAPGTRYYFRLQASHGDKVVSGPIANFTTLKGAQTIHFDETPANLKYGASPIQLTVWSTSRLPLQFKVIEGSAEVRNYSAYFGVADLVIKGAGTIKIAVSQAGNSQYLAAKTVIMTMTVAKADLTVTADNETITAGAKVPALGFSITGFVNGDTQGAATEGAPLVTTLVTSETPPGHHSIYVSDGTASKRLVSSNYAFKFVDGTLTVNP